MSPTIETPGSVKIDSNIKTFTYALVLTVALGATHAWACMDGPCKAAWNVSSRAKDAGVPAWVVEYCRPANGAEILGRFAGAGYWLYPATGDFCYFDPRPILQ
jgi:hypothetical protein